MADMQPAKQTKRIIESNRNVMIRLLPFGTGATLIVSHSGALPVILNEAERREGSGLRTGDTPHPRARSFGDASG
jgi:hypothetical protein